MKEVYVLTQILVSSLTGEKPEVTPQVFEEYVHCIETIKRILIQSREFEYYDEDKMLSEMYLKTPTWIFQIDKMEIM